MFGLLKKTEKIQEELRQGMISDVERIVVKPLASIYSSNTALVDRLAELEEQIRQAQRQERRRQTAIESILETEGKILEAQERVIEERMEEKMEEKMETPPPLEAIMALADNLALACLSKPKDPASSILQGKLTDLLACYGLSLITDVGNAFDPERHEACAARRNSTRPENTVLEVVRPGFLAKGKVMRYAMVVVNRYDAEPEDKGLDRGPNTQLNAPPLYQMYRNESASWEGKIYD
ncbi:MAG: nucleotide exchange factor GrpE [Synergistaceae bacterium]|jgi:molecular chaperone GrpE|nr:nucleotide exchange factor GrpE [Synergistaceae bacterium]